MTNIVLRTRDILRLFLLPVICSCGYIWSAPDSPTTSHPRSLKTTQKKTPLVSSSPPIITPPDIISSKSTRTVRNHDDYVWAPPPPMSPATNLPNKIYKWKNNQNIRYQQAGDITKPAVLLVHGLFSNSDHWRHTINSLANCNDGYCVYAIDLWGCGYSSKIPRDSEDAKSLNGERRFFNNGDEDDALSPPSHIVTNVELGTDSGGSRIAGKIDLLHPFGSPYNFYTWAELLSDFTRDVILPQQQRPQQHNGKNNNNSNEQQNSNKVTIVGNSIGVTAALQSVLDTPNLYNGLFMINPHFRPLHRAQMPLPDFTMPVLQVIQHWLRTKGHSLFEFLAKPWIVKHILKEPYAVKDAIDDTLVNAILDPLLTDGADDVIFDMISYSGGPLVEQQLGDMITASSSSTNGNEKKDVPVWVCYGLKDPWISPRRMEHLRHFENVKNVVRIDDAGHCPQDETPDKVNLLLSKFVTEVNNKKKAQVIHDDCVLGKNDEINKFAKVSFIEKVIPSMPSFHR